MRETSIAALAKWGADVQLLQTQEELMELAIAISHFRRGRSGSRQEILEEVGDVYLMLDQVRAMFGDGEIDNAVIKSVEKLSAMLNAGGKQ